MTTYLLAIATQALASESVPVSAYVSLLIRVVPVIAALIGVVGVYFFRKKASEKELAEIHKIYAETHVLQQEGTSKTYKDLLLMQKEMIDNQADAIKCMQSRLDKLTGDVEDLWEQNRQCKEENAKLKEEVDDLRSTLAANPQRARTTS
jgi:outer membrane murein-binding lipoprotein Lpp